MTGRRVTEVLAEFRSFGGGPLEDYAALLLRFDGGAPGSLVLSAGAAGRKNQLLFELEGTTAGLTWDQEQPTEMLFRPADGPKQIVVKDPGANAETARSMSRYPAGHGEGYGEAFRNLFEDVYARSPESRTAVPDVRRRPPRRRDRRGRRGERPRRRLGAGRDVTPNQPPDAGCGSIPAEVRLQGTRAR